MKNNNYNIPAGMRDWLPGEADRKRKIINRLLDNMSLWGYQEIGTPILEYYHVFNELEEGIGKDDLYKLIDRDGSILAMRSEMTIPIARVISSKLAKHSPYRLMYGAEVFRYENIQAGRLRGFNQVGVELIGEKSPEIDAEVISLVVDSLQKSGMQEFTVSLGHMGVLRGLLEYLSLEEKELDIVRKFVLEKDFAGLEQLFDKTIIDKEIRDRLLNLLTRPLNNEELMNGIEGMPLGIQEALKDLSEIMEIVEQFGISSYIQIDLSTLRSQGYYTGMVFEVYTAGIGYPIGGGGRYDNLLKRFGIDLPATGFALGVERLMMSLVEKEDDEKRILLVAEKPELNRSNMIKKAQNLRAQGNKVIVEFKKLEKSEAEMLAKDNNANIYWLGGDEDYE